MSRPVHVLEFRMVRGTGGGPEKTILAGATMADPDRTRVTVCYLRDARDDVFGIDNRARAMGVDYTEILERHSLDWRTPALLSDLVRQRQVDVIHSHDYKTDLLAWLASRRTGAALVATAHGWTGHSSRERWAYYPFHKRLLARFPLVIAVSSEIRDELIRHGASPGRVRVLLNGIDPGAFTRRPEGVAAARTHFGIAPDAVVVGAVGRLEPQKRFDLLLRAFRAVRDKHPRAQLLIAGDGSLRETLAQQIVSEGLQASCRLVGQVHDIAEFHHALNLFVQSSSYEGTPNVVLEAMAMETPVIATDVGGTRELCEHDNHGVIVPAERVDALQTAMLDLLDDPARRRALAAAARTRVVEQLSFQQRVRALDDLYAELNEGRRA
jgi:glycosyltransferase involved in cell wall biosynthesis